MVTAEEVYTIDLKHLCDLFGFIPMERYLKIKQVPKDIIFMHAMLSANGFYHDVLKKEGSFDIRDEKKVRKLRNKAESYIKHLVGGSGELGWVDKHELLYQALKVITKPQAINLFWYPKFIDEEKLKKSLPYEWLPYVPQYIPELKFIAFIKFIYPEWIELVERCKKTCLEHEKLRKKRKSTFLPWYWSGKINKDQHAAIIHESIHCILTNSGVDKVFDHDAYREGIDVFFHRKSSLFLGYYNKHFWSGRDIKNYWQASEFFWKEFENIENENDFKTIPKILLNPNDERVRRIIEKIKSTWPSSRDFHV